MRNRAFVVGVGRLRGTMLVLVAAVALLSACGASPSAAATPTPTIIRTATPTAIPTVLYQADWSKGADGWTLPPHWSIQNGELLNDGTGLAPITVPYTVTVPDYEVDLVARVVNVATPQSCGNLYGIQALDSGGQQLYYTQIWCIGTHPQNPGASALYVSAGGSEGFATADFILNNDWKTYRIRVHGEGIRFYPNSAAAVGGANSPVPLAPASFVLLDQHVQFEIKHFTVLQLRV